MSCPDIKLQLLQKNKVGTTTKRDRDFLISVGICPQCQKRPLEPNKKMCYECLGRARDRYHERKANGSLQKKLTRNNERKMAAYYERKKAGICTKCGKQSAVHGLLCNRCYMKYRSKQVQKKLDIDRSERVSHGMCYICGEKELYEKHRVCQKCYEKRLETLPAMWARIDNSYFRMQNDLMHVKK